MWKALKFAWQHRELISKYGPVAISMMKGIQQAVDAKGEEGSIISEKEWSSLSKQAYTVYREIVK